MDQRVVPREEIQDFCDQEGVEYCEAVSPQLALLGGTAVCHPFSQLTRWAYSEPWRGIGLVGGGCGRCYSRFIGRLRPAAGCTGWIHADGGPAQESAGSDCEPNRDML
jgi:hypothetical protein